MKWGNHKEVKKMKELIIDSMFNFTNDRSIIKARIDSIIQTLKKDIESFSSYVNVKTVFKIIVEAKPVFLEIQRISPTFSSIFQHTAKSLNGIQLSDLALFEKKMMLISLVVIFENFAKDVLLLGAFFYPERAINLFPDDQKDEKKKVESFILNKEVLGFESAVKKRLSFKKRAKGLKKAWQTIYNIDFFPNNEVEDVLHDLIGVRNIIIHENANPKQKDFESIKFKDVVKRNSFEENLKVIGSDSSKSTLPNVITFSLNLFNADFERAVLNGLMLLISHINGNILSQF